MFVTPYQLAFIMHEPKMSEPGKVFAPWNRHRVGLMMCDNVVDFFFLCDILLNCNTGVYLEESDEWILDRAALVGRYRASGWLYVDIASLFPYDEMSSEDKLSLLKLLKLLRLFKLLKVLRAPRILAKWQKVFSLSFKTGLILKYTVVLITILHLSACVIRMAHDLQTNDGEKKHIQTYLNTSGPDLHRGKFHKGNFPSPLQHPLVAAMRAASRRETPATSPRGSAASASAAASSRSSRRRSSRARRSAARGSRTRGAGGRRARASRGGAPGSTPRAIGA